MSRTSCTVVLVAMALVGACGEQSVATTPASERQTHWQLPTDGVDVLAAGQGQVLLVGGGTSQLVEATTGKEIALAESDDPDSVESGSDPTWELMVDNVSLQVRLSDYRIVDDGNEEQLSHGLEVTSGEYTAVNSLDGLEIRGPTGGRWSFPVEEPHVDESLLVILEGWVYAGLSNSQALGVRLDPAALDAAAAEWGQLWGPKPLDASQQTITAVTAGMQEYLDALYALDLDRLRSALSTRCVAANDWDRIAEAVGAATEADRAEAAAITGEIVVKEIDGDGALVVFTGDFNQIPQQFVVQGDRWVMDDC